MTPRDNGQDEQGEATTRKRAVRPRDAASVILLRGSQAAPEVLLGRRRRSARFVPGVYVFPGGSLDREDRVAALDLDLPQQLLRKLNRHCPADTAQGLVWTAIRETWEETGLLIGRAGAADPGTGSPLHDAMSASGLVPDAAALEYVARAITPSRNPIRFNTRFFLADAAKVAGSLITEGELLDIGWRDVTHALERMELMGVTRFALAEALKHWRDEDGSAATRPIARLAHRGKTRFVVLE